MAGERLIHDEAADLGRKLDPEGRRIAVGHHSFSLGSIQALSHLYAERAETGGDFDEIRANRALSRIFERMIESAQLVPMPPIEERLAA